MPKRLEVYKCEFCQKQFDDLQVCMDHERNCRKIFNINDHFTDIFKIGDLVLVPEDSLETVYDIASLSCMFHHQKYGILCEVIGVNAELEIVQEEDCNDNGNNVEVLHASGLLGLEVRVITSDNEENHFDFKADSFDGLDFEDMLEDSTLKSLMEDHPTFVDTEGEMLYPSSHPDVRQILIDALEAVSEKIKALLNRI